MLDGSDCPKQGQELVSLKRQYCGAVGKRVYCQAGGFLGYASRHSYTLLVGACICPQGWIEDVAYAARRRVALGSTRGAHFRGRQRNNAVGMPPRCPWLPFGLLQQPGHQGV